jgi:23S rRNA pseudouridine2605 synthase
MVHDPLRTPGGDEGQSPEGGGERIAKALARAGVASRREVERLIAEGRVAINGRTLTTPAIRIEADDILTVDGEVVADAEPVRLFRYHKPSGLVTSHKDPQGRPTVFQALPPGLPRLISVGRLDLATEGLLLLTNDGGLARSLELPSTGLVRRYRARAFGRITQDRLDALKSGVTVEGVRYGPIEAVIDKARDGASGANLWISVTLSEGKNREVRKVLESVGLKVNRLIRLAYGPFALSTLPPGEIEEVGPRVIRELFSDLIPPEDLPKGDKPKWSRRAPVSEKRREGAGEAIVSAEAPETRGRPAYKAGWARPKPKPPGGRPPPKPGARKPESRKPDSRKPGSRKPDAERAGKTDISRPATAPKVRPVKPSGSPPAGGRPPGPRGPNRSPSPAGRPGAPRKGPPKGGGRGPRG